MASRKRQADVVGNVRRTHGTERDRIVVANLVEAVHQHHRTRAPEAIRAPIERIERKPVPSCNSGEQAVPATCQPDHDPLTV
jgi:hypothetical protein